MPLRSVDAAERMFTFKMAFWSLAGLIIGGAVGSFKFGFLGALIGAPLGFGIVFGFSRLVMRAGAGTFAHINAPSGDSTPHKIEYSRPQSLEARGLYREAVDAYEVFTLNTPADPEPYLRIARIYRDHLQEFDSAVAWFRKGRGTPKMAEPLDLLITQEIVEVYTRRLNAPQRAIPELARLIERFPHSSAAPWARERLKELREQVAQQGPT